MSREPIEPLSLYVGKEDHPRGDKLTHFPAGTQVDGKPMPHRDDLSRWLKVPLATIALNSRSFQTFNIHIHPISKAHGTRPAKIRE